MMLFTRKRNSPHAEGVPSREETLASMARLSRKAEIASRAIAVLAVLRGILLLVFAVPTISRMAEAGVSVERAGQPTDQVTLVAADGMTALSLLTTEGHSFVSTVVRICLFAAAACIAARFFGAISSTKRPFALERARDLTRIGILLIVEGLCAKLVGIVCAVAVMHVLGYLGSWSTGDLFEWMPLALGVFVLALARVFAYGCVLQEQDDGLV